MNREQEVPPNRASESACPGRNRGFLHPAENKKIEKKGSASLLAFRFPDLPSDLLLDNRGMGKVLCSRGLSFLVDGADFGVGPSSIP